MDWVWDRIKGAFNFWVEGLLILGATALALLVWSLVRHRVNGKVAVPTGAGPSGLQLLVGPTAR